MQAPGQAQPQQRQQYEQGRAEAQVEVFLQAFEGQLVFTHRLQRHDTERRALAAQQLDLDVVHEKLLAIGFANPRKFITAPVVARLVVDVFFLGRPRAPHQMPLTVVDVTEQATVSEVEAFVRQLRRHQQAVVFDPRGGNQRGDIRGQALLDGILQRQAERALHGGQQAQHKQHGQGGGREHQAHT